MLKTLKSLSKFVLIPALAFGSLVSSAVPASSSGSDSISLYFSAPFVNGTHITDTTVRTETFNSLACPSAGSSVPTAVGTMQRAAGSNTCIISTSVSTDAGSPDQRISGYTQSPFLSGNLDKTFVMTEPVKYVGFWWMMGSNGNAVKFYDADNSVIAQLSSDDIMNFIGVSYGDLLNSDTGTLATFEGGSHPRRHYFRAPINYTGSVASPFMDYQVSSFANEPWVYLNLFVTGSRSISKVELTGSNFELDNLSTSELESTPRGDMVELSNVVQSAQTVNWNPTNSNLISSSPLTPSAVATVTNPTTGGGAISYSVVSAGTAGCTVNSSTGVITATGEGTCRIKATAAAVSGWLAGNKEVTFTFTSTSSGLTSSSGSSAFTVTYEANGANGFRYQSSGTTTAALPMNNFQKPGHYFVGWNTKADGSGIAYPDRATYAYASDITLFAQWSKITAKHLVTTFNADKPVLLKGMKKRLRAWAKTLPADASLTCEGSTSGAKARAFDRRLAKARATNSCEFIQSLRPEITFTVTLNPASATAVKARHAWIYLNTESN